MSLITLKNINYTYPLESKATIKNLNLTLESGKVYGLIGANNAGKTTLCNIIRGFIPSVYRGELEGEVLLKGKNLTSYDSGEIASIIGYSFQNPFTQISGVKETVYEEIAYGMENLGVLREKMIQKVEELLKLFNLEELKDKNPFELSGGQKQRVALASIIALDPEVIILDEPTSQLDPKSTEDIFNIIKLLKSTGKTIILIEHKIDLVAEYCDDVILMENGQIIMQGPSRSVLTNESVLKHGGQLPQVTLFFLEGKKAGKISADRKIPITINEAYEFLGKEK
ncbi:energy-coupling factor ABC transporter ATP-binding protein [Vagococcus fluvialis]|uniref:energy-coupling factor ABC transporter ATP-binding protein n=1 Tax=Vagococcus fluvialis TaxID=2738 RepID=UPI003B5B034A